MKIQPTGVGNGSADPSVSQVTSSSIPDHEPLNLTLISKSVSISSSDADKTVQDKSPEAQIPVDLHDHSLHISIGDDKEIHVKVIDNQTGRVVREIPAKSAMQLLSDWTGIWVDIKA